jgi:hypothetical protein
MPNRRPELQLIAPSATPEEAAAVVAALERFMRATAPAVVSHSAGRDPWTHAALIEGVSGGEPSGEWEPWINT